MLTGENAEDSGGADERGYRPPAKANHSATGNSLGPPDLVGTDRAGVTRSGPREPRMGIGHGSSIARVAELVASDARGKLAVAMYIC